MSVNVFFIATLLANGMWGGQMPGTAGTTMDELMVVMTMVMMTMMIMMMRRTRMRMRMMRTEVV